MVFENGTKNIQAAAYNGAGTVFEISKLWTLWKRPGSSIIQLTPPNYHRTENNLSRPRGLPYISKS